MKIRKVNIDDSKKGIEVYLKRNPYTCFFGKKWWENKGFDIREDLVYRNKNIVKIERIDIYKKKY